MLIVEFYGPPGCGKTTLCDEVEKELRASGYRVKNFQKPTREVLLWDKVKGKWRRCCYRYLCANRKIKAVLKTVWPYLTEESHFYWIDRILEVYYTIQQGEKSGVEIALLDEGCLQFITSVFHGKKVPSEMQQLIDTLAEEFYRNRTIIYNCQIDLNENYCRLVKRSKADDRFLKEDREESYRLLNQKKENIECVLDMLACKNPHLIGQRTGFPSKDFILKMINERLA